MALKGSVVTQRHLFLHFRHAIVRHDLRQT